MNVYNILGRTEKEQTTFDDKSESAGSLWGRWPILYEFIHPKYYHNLHFELCDLAYRIYGPI